MIALDQECQHDVRSNKKKERTDFKEQGCGILKEWNTFIARNSSSPVSHNPFKEAKPIVRAT